jgi:uridine kinase
MLIIGIAGPSCSGKTTIAETLVKEMPDAIHLRFDSYTKPQLRTVPVTGPDGITYQSAERPELYNGEKLAKDLDELIGKHKNSDKTVIVEGFLLLTFSEIRERLTHSFFVEISHEESLRRRDARPSEIMGAQDEVVEQMEKAFRVIGGSEYEKFGRPQAQLQGVTKLDGMKSTQDLVEEIKSVVYSGAEGRGKETLIPQRADIPVRLSQDRVKKVL